MTKVEYRPHRPGDLGWIVHRHGVIYAQEFGFPEGLEGLVARIMADFVAHRDPDRERFFIAERDGQILGGVLLCVDREADKDEEGGGMTRKSSAKLRTFFVERAARGMGVGSQLLRRSVEYAREKGYARITLTTETKLTSARRLYAAEGFKITKVEDCGDFAPPGSKQETWQLDL